MTSPGRPADHPEEIDDEAPTGTHIAVPPPPLLESSVVVADFQAYARFVTHPPEDSSAGPNNSASPSRGQADVTASLSWSPNHLLRLSAGTVLDEVFEVRGLLGMGGNSEVYEAVDIRTDVELAIKVARESAMASRLRTKAKLFQRLGHSAFPLVHHIGAFEDGEYVALEFLRGTRLDTYLNERPDLPAIRTAGDVILQLADALLALHTAGYAHGDLRPGNVVLCEQRRVVLLGARLPRAALRTTSQLAGFAAYLPPEFLDGRDQPTARQLDLYALGVVGYELLVGRLPRRTLPSQRPGHESRASVALDVLRRRANAPAALVSAIDLLLSEDPAKRPDVVEKVLEILAPLRV